MLIHIAEIPQPNDDYVINVRLQNVIWFVGNLFYHILTFLDGFKGL